jgi:hypothetical protein
MGKTEVILKTFKRNLIYFRYIGNIWKLLNSFKTKTPHFCGVLGLLKYKLN